MAPNSRDRLRTTGSPSNHSWPPVENEPNPVPSDPVKPELYSPFVPLMWLLIPFILVLLYGIFSG